MKLRLMIEKREQTKTEMMRMTLNRVLWLNCLVLLLAGVFPVRAFYNPTTGRWLSRDPIEERGGVDLYCFVANTPTCYFDFLGKMARGSINFCFNACEDFKNLRYADMEAEDVPSGGIICCNGVKFICTWGADREGNERVKQIRKGCTIAHESLHVGSTECNACSVGLSEVKWTKSGKSACEEELEAHKVSWACLIAGIAECGSDFQCKLRINALIAHHAEAISNYRKLCENLKK
jgi:hypothetical protein